MSLRDEAVEIAAAIRAVNTFSEAVHRVTRRLDRFGMDHFSYLDLGEHADMGEPVRLATTYRIEWQERYRRQNYVAIDPAVKETRRTILPVDWRRMDWSPPAAARLFGEAREFGVGRNGISFPLHGVGGGFAVMTVSTDDPAGDWDRRAEDLTMSFLLIATTLHAQMEDRSACDPEELLLTLSRSELDCLRWFATGRSAESIGARQRRSEDEVRRELASACRKLDVSTATHAVSRAITFGLIPFE